MPVSSSQSMLELLRRPYPFPATAQQNFFRSLVLGFVVFVLVSSLVLAPYPIALYLKLLYGLAYAVACLVVTLVNSWVLAKFFQFLDKKWSIGKHLAWIGYNFLSVAIANLALSVALSITNWSFSSFLSFLGITLLIGSMPLVLIIIYRQNQLLKANLQAAQGLQQASSDTTMSATTKISLSGNNTREAAIEITTQQLLYLEANKNYVHLHLLNQDSPLSIRATLSGLEKQMTSHQQFIRCHRAFIVNLDHIKSITGNSQGLQISLTGAPNVVPVSRSYIPLLRERLG